jgi:hypothetical protein
MRYYLNSGLFAFVLIFFFLPFIEIRCNDSALAEMSGIHMATGAKPELNDPSLMDYLKDNPQFSALKNQEAGPDPMTIIAGLSLFAGLVLQIVLRRRRELVAIICALTAFLVLIALQVIMKYQWNKQMAGAEEMMTYVKFTLNFVIGYWLAVGGSFLLSALNGYYLIAERRDKPLVVFEPDHESPDTLEEV